MDCGIEYKNFKYNFEVKCPKISQKNEKTLYLALGGQFEDFDNAKNVINNSKNNIFSKLLERGSDYDKILDPFESGGIARKNNTLLSFLKETEKKSLDGELNILIVSLYSKNSFSEWTNYFLEILNDIKQRDTFTNVDGVIFTSTLNSHVNYKEISINAWNWKEHLSFFIPNSFKEKNIEAIKILMNEIIPFKKNLLLVKQFEELEELMILELANEIHKEKSKYLFNLLNLTHAHNIEILVPYIESFILQKFNSITKTKIIMSSIEENAYEKYINKKNIEFTQKKMFLPTILINEIEKDNRYFFQNEKYIYLKDR